MEVGFYLRHEGLRGSELFCSHESHSSMDTAAAAQIRTGKLIKDESNFS